MSDYHDRGEMLWEQLHQLLELPVVPQFSREFYGLIVEWAVQAQDQAPAEWAVHLLEIEERYYHRLQRVEEGEAPPATLLEKRQIALGVLNERVEGAGEQPDRAGEVARRLILAECCYFLERPAEVVAHLESVLNAGGSDPLLSFALGHARFLLALRSFVHLQVPGAELVIADQSSLQSLCLAAVNAFEGALTGGPRDAEIRWWIGRVLLTAGFTEQAQEILSQVEAPADFLEESAPGCEQAQRQSARGIAAPIDDAELTQFIQGIQRSHPLSHLLYPCGKG